MGLEVATYISGLNAANPVGVSDPKSQGDDHLRLIKSTLLNSFPGITGAVTATHTELNRLAGVTGVTGAGKLVLDTSPNIATPTITTPNISNPTLSGTVAGSPTASGQWTWQTSINSDFPGVRIGNTNAGASATGSLYFDNNSGNARAGMFLGSSAYAIYGGAGSFNIGTFQNVPFALLHNATVRAYVSASGLTDASGNVYLTTATGAQLGVANTFANNILWGNGVGTLTFAGSDSYWDSTAAIFLRPSSTQAMKLTTSLIECFVPIQARVATSSETSGTLTAASANKHLALTGNITLNNSVFTTGDKNTGDPGASNRTITRGAGVAMYVNGVDSASATAFANQAFGIHWRSASVCVLSGAVA